MKIPNRTRCCVKFLGGTASAIALMMAMLPSAIQAQMVRTEADAARILAIEKLAARDGVVSGEVRNKSAHAVRDVQLLIRYTWLWDDERHPGKVDPGTSTYYTLKETIDPGGKIQFVYKPSPPLPKIANGRFETTATIAAFSEIIPPKSGAMP